MRLSDINPFLRYAELQPSIMSKAPHSCAYDYRLFYIISGNTHVVVKDDSFELGAGSVIFIRPATPYFFVEKVKTIVLNFDITREHTDITKPLHPRHVPNFDVSKVLENNPPSELSDTVIIRNALDLEPMFQECLTNYSFPSETSDAITSSILKRILCSIAQNATTEENTSSQIAHDVMLYVKNNYDKALSNTDIAAIFGYHSYHLNRIFKESMGMTIHQAVLLERINIAKKLLRTTELSIDDISAEAGFSERTHFCTAFKRHTGKTPSEYKRSKSHK